MDALTSALDAWLAANPWPRPQRGDLLPLCVFERKGILDCFWFNAASTLPLTSFHETLRNKREALIAKFYGSNASGRTTFMANGYPILVQYANWCDAEGINYAMDNPAKAKRFLEVRIDAGRRGWSARTKAGHKGRANSAAESAFNTYRQSVCHLTALSQWQGYGFDMVYTEEVQTLRLLLMADVKRAKNRVQDSAATSSLLTKRLDPDEWRAMIEGLWAGRLDKTFKTAAGQARAQMRALLMTSLNQTAGRRGGDLRNLDLRMFLWHALPDVRPVSAWAIGASLRAVKEDNLLEDREHLLGWMRSKDRPACPVGILAAYLVWMHDVGGTGGTSAPFLKVMKADFAKTNPIPEWWSLSLIGGRNAATSISGSTHTKLQHAAFESGDVYGKKAVTHIHRPTALGNLLEGGVVSTDAALYQGWVHGVWADTYAKASFKTIPMLKAHGWDPRMDAYECWWEGRDDDIPAELKAAVFPGLDEIADMALARRTHDRSAVEFTKVLKVLRRIFIEDSIVHQLHWPTFPAYESHAIWTTPSLYNIWQAYAEAERTRILQRQREWQMRTQDPGIAAALIEQLNIAHKTQKELALALTHVAGTSSISTSHIITHGTHDINHEANPLSGPRDPPELQEPHVRDLSLTYARWAEAPIVGGVTMCSVRDVYMAYLKEHKRIAWSKIFPKNKMNAAKVRYYKMTPFLHYVDACADAATRLTTIQGLQAIMDAAGIDGPNFIKQCFYTLCHPADAGEAAKKPPPILPQILAAKMRDLGLRLPEGGGAGALLKEMG